MERRSLKKKNGLQRDSKPVTSALPVRCSTNWAMKPHIGSERVLLNAGHALSATIINVSFRISFVCKIKGWSSPSSLNNTKMHSRKFLTIIPSIIDHKLWITSSTFKSWQKKKNSISIKAQILIIKLKKKKQIQTFQTEIRVTAKTQTR